MKKLKDIIKNKISPENGTAVALGIFDGVHLGHRAVIGKIMEYRSDSLSTAVFTFNSDTLEKKHNKPFKYIYKNSQKLNILERFDIDYLYCPDFNDVKNMTTDEFAKKILAEKMNAKKVVCGRRFRFGKDAAGDFRELRELGLKYGFEVSAVSPVLDGSVSVSSSLIRLFISEGNIQKANNLLGCNYQIYGKVIYGKQLGRTIGMPTINQRFDDRQLVPHYGVYASRTIIDGKEYLSVTDIGVKPTVQDNNIPLAETHILDFSGNLYDKNITVILDDMIRDEMKFMSVEELKCAIEKDINTIRLINGNLR